MGSRKTGANFSPEMRERAVRLVLEAGGDAGTRWGTLGSTAAKIGCSREALRRWVRQSERDGGQRAGPTTDGRERIRVLERGVRELRQADGILREASAYSAVAELDRRSKP